MSTYQESHGQTSLLYQQTLLPIMSTGKLIDVPSEDPPSYEASSTSSGPSATPTRSPSGVRRLRPPPPLELPALSLLRGKRVILASGSPRRRQLLTQIGLTNIEIIPSKFEENLPKTSPFEYVVSTATQKALTVYKQEVDNEEKGEPALIIAADTIVVSSLGEILEKPKSEAHHIHMLKTLRDSGLHHVYTAVVLIMPLASGRHPGYALETATESTAVKFDKDLTDELILAYVRTREGADKAGGYGAQGTGAILIESVEGSFDNVIGLPLRVTLKMIEKITMKADDEDIMANGELLEADEEDDE
jgi:septum formation protein